MFLFNIFILDWFCVCPPPLSPVLSQGSFNIMSCLYVHGFSFVLRFSENRFTSRVFKRSQVRESSVQSTFFSYDILCQNNTKHVTGKFSLSRKDSIKLKWVRRQYLKRTLLHTDSGVGKKSRLGRRSTLLTTKFSQ